MFHIETEISELEIKAPKIPRVSEVPRVLDAAAPVLVYWVVE